MAMEDLDSPFFQIVNDLFNTSDTNPSMISNWDDPGSDNRSNSSQNDMKTTENMYSNGNDNINGHFFNPSDNNSARIYELETDFENEDNNNMNKENPKKRKRESENENGVNGVNGVNVYPVNRSEKNYQEELGDQQVLKKSRIENVSRKDNTHNSKEQEAKPKISNYTKDLPIPNQHPTTPQHGISMSPNLSQTTIPNSPGLNHNSQIGLLKNIPMSPRDIANQKGGTPLGANGLVNSQIPMSPGMNGVLSPGHIPINSPIPQNMSNGPQIPQNLPPNIPSNVHPNYHMNERDYRRMRHMPINPRSMMDERPYQYGNPMPSNPNMYSGMPRYVVRKDDEMNNQILHLIRERIEENDKLLKLIQLNQREGRLSANRDIMIRFRSNVFKSLQDLEKLPPLFGTGKLDPIIDISFMNYNFGTLIIQNPYDQNRM